MSTQPLSTLQDPELRTFEIFELGADRRYTRARGATDLPVTDVPGCPDLLLDVPALWAEIDRLAAEQDD